MSEICTVNDESLARAVEIIHDGGLVVIPTDTVYGVACDPRNIEAIRKVFAAKQRPKYKSLQVLLPSIESMEKLHLTLPVPLNRLAAMFMPGDALGDAVDLYLDGGATPGHVSSTVVAADPHERDGIAILREGVIRELVIRKALTLNGGALGA